MAQKFQDNYSITQLFIDKKVKVWVNEVYVFTLSLHSVRDMFQNERWNMFYHLITSDLNELLKSFKINIKNIKDFINNIIFDLGQYAQFRQIYELLVEQLPKLFIDDDDFLIDYIDKEIKINDLNITEEIWDYIIYLLKLSYGEKVTKPLTFDSEEAKQFYLKQKELENKIRKTKEKGSQDSSSDSIMKIFLSIIYAFPSLTIDYLFDQTMAQIQWLQNYAAGSVSYEVNAKAFAAGNMKKGSKLDFFIK